MRWILAALLAVSAYGQTVLRPARVFDGETMRTGIAVRVNGNRIEAIGPAAGIDTAGAKVVDLPGLTLMPGLIEGHSHILLHPYNETKWNDQVAHEGLALRVARAVNHLRATLMAGFTTVRDLGTEGAQYADVELKQAVEQGIVPGPRVLTSTRAIVATGSCPRASRSNGAFRKAPRRPTASIASSARCAISSGTARIGSSYTAITVGVPDRARGRPSPSRK
jgi:imidazolonepropionase-like amidohydrolase